MTAQDGAWKRRVRLAAAGTALALLLAGFAAGRIRGGENLWPGDVAVAHALGGVAGGRDNSNSLEAFRQSYERGFRTFEVDLMLTEAGELVLAHSQREWEAYSTWPELAGYTTLRFGDLCGLMADHPEIWVITDTKSTDAEGIRREFSALVAAAEAAGHPEVLERMVIQLYHEEMYDVVREVYPFANYIFTLYQRWDGDMAELEKICAWCREREIPALTMWYYLLNDSVMETARRYGLEVYVHTVNDPAQAQTLLDLGAAGVYTDDLSPALLHRNGKD